MATLADHMLAQQIIQNLARMAPNMQDNAAAYKVRAQRIVDAVAAANAAKIAAGTDPVANTAADILIAATSKAKTDFPIEINGDMDEFARRIGLIENLATRNSTQMTASLNALGITVASANADKNAMKNAAIALKSASKTTQTEINAAVDIFIAAVPVYERIF